MKLRNNIKIWREYSSKTGVCVADFIASKSDIVKFQCTKSKVLVNSFFYSPPRSSAGDECYLRYHMNFSSAWLIPAKNLSCAQKWNKKPQWKKFTIKSNWTYLSSSLTVRNKISNPTSANHKVGYLRLGDIKSVWVVCAIVKRQASESPFPFMQRRDFLSADSFWSKVFAVK